MSKADLRVCYLPKTEYVTWDAFVQTSPQSTIYGQSWYLSILQVPFSILVVYQQHAIIAGIVLTKDSRNHFANPLLCKYLGVYFAPFSGSSYRQETKRRKAVRLLLTELNKRPSFYYFFHPKFATHFPFHVAGFDNKLRYSYWIDLQQPMAVIEQNFNSKLRTQIRAVQRQNYTLTEGVPVEDFTVICRQTFLQKGAKFPFTISWLNQYCQQLLDRKALKIIGIKNHQNQLMAAAALLLTKDTATLILSGFDKQIMGRQVNELLLYNCLKIAKKQCAFFDFEGSMIPEIEAFYRKFGGEFVPYLTICKQTLWQVIYEQLRQFFRQVVKR